MKIKGFDKNLCCRGMQYEIGKEYKKENDGKPLELCSDTVYHYCDSLSQVHNFYSCNDETNRYCEIEVLGQEVSDREKCGSDHIRIIREITGDELKALKGLNSSNTGLFNSGDRNSGYRNSGDRNSGDRNSGDRNSGYRNSGYMNSGYRNSGDRNSGYMNSGDRNSGVANKCNGSNGVFCNEDDMNIRIFNKPSGMSLRDFYRSEYWEAMTEVPYMLTEWVYYTKEEREEDPDKDRVGGYLKVRTPEEAWAYWWSNLSEGARETINRIPNFDAAVFKDITGIEV